MNRSTSMNQSRLMVSLSLVLMGFIYPDILYAQAPQHVQTADTTQIWLVRTTDGNDFIGSIIEQTAENLVLVTANIGQVTIPRDQVEHMQPVKSDRIVDGKLWLENPLPNRYFLGPNSLGLNKGQGYYQNIWVFFNQVTVTPADNFSIGFGTIPILGGDGLPFWIAPRLSVPLAGKEGNVFLGFGGLLGGVIGVDGGVGGYLYSNMAVGSKDTNFGIGLGLANDGEEWADRPAITLGGMHRAGRRLYIIGESFVVRFDGEFEGFGLLGARTVGRHMAFDFGLIFPIGVAAEDLVLLPWVGASIPFGN